MHDLRPQQVTAPAVLPRQRRPHAAARRRAGSRAARRDPMLPPASVVVLALLSTSTIAVVDRGLTGRLSQFFDLSFVLVCIVAALAVRRSGLFTVGVLPPLLMGGVFAVFTVVDPGTLTADHLAFASTVLTGLAHHAAALVAGHASAVTIAVARGAAGSDERRGSARGRARRRSDGTP
ncbi:MAG: hypothetical protein GEU96_10005 [Propionibacteriales bacterium]|nr:hypothetical protein [Propionibacteriales bacterium]